MAKKPVRSPERAAAVLDRAARMGAFKAPMVDQRLFDKQIRTPGSGKTPFNATDFPPERLKNAGAQQIPLKQIKSGQPTVSLKAAKGKLTAKGGSLPMVIKQGDMYYVADGNHRLTAQRALGHTSAQVQVLEMTAHRAMTQSVNRQALSNAIGHMSVSAAATVAAGSAAISYAKAREAGKSQMRALVEGSLAGAATGAAPLAVGSATGAAVRAGLISKTAFAIASKAALPLAVVGTAAYYGWRSMQEGKDASSVVKSAAWGAVNGVIPVDLAMEAYGATTKSGTTASKQGKQAMTPEQAKSYQALNTAFQGRMAGERAPKLQGEASGAGQRGYANPSVQRAAQEARGVVNFTDWAERAPAPKKG